MEITADLPVMLLRLEYSTADDDDGYYREHQETTTTTNTTGEDDEREGIASQVLIFRCC